VCHRTDKHGKYRDIQREDYSLPGDTMISSTLIPDRRPSYLRGGNETFIDFRRRRELDAEARVERRRLDAAEQTSELNVPGARIRAWELVHSLRMPSGPAHPVLKQIAIMTHLSLGDIHEEQRVRSGAAAS
jgi:hypothetical protein